MPCDDVVENRIIVFDPAGAGAVGEAPHRDLVGRVDTGGDCPHGPEFRDAEVAFVGHRLPERVTGGGGDRGLDVGEGVAGRIIQSGVVQVTQHCEQHVRDIGGVVRADRHLPRYPVEQERPDEVDGPEAEPSIDAVMAEVQRGIQDKRINGQLLFARPHRTAADEQLLRGLEFVGLLGLEVCTHVRAFLADRLPARLAAVRVDRVTTSVEPAASPDRVTSLDVQPRVGILLIVVGRTRQRIRQ